MSARLTIVVAPHPDDEVLGCGGLIARRSRAGETVHVVVVTRGAPDIFDPALIDRGRAELAEAHAVLGAAHCHFLDFPAPKLDTVPVHRIADSLKDVIGSTGATEVLLPHGGDIHTDHRIVHIAGLVATRPRAGSVVERVLAYETLSETEWAPPTLADAFVPTVFVDISDVLDTKLDALAKYQSQLHEFPDPRSVRAARALAELRGASAGFDAAEAFALLRSRE